VNFNKTQIVVLTSLTLLTITSIARASEKRKESLRVVSSVDLSRYAGRWYEVARLPNKFEDMKNKTCGDVTAEYTLRPNGKLYVRNRCVYQNGKIEIAKGVARVTDKKTNARLEINFAPAILGIFPFVWGDYNIIELAPDYSYALIGNLDRQGLWVLSRTPQLDEATYKRLLDSAAQQGFNTPRVTKTKQAP
jgi:apolipoprotein D and lipocalin family protein